MLKIGRAAQAAFPNLFVLLIRHDVEWFDKYLKGSPAPQTGMQAGK